MRNTKPWAALAIAVPLLLATASSSFADPADQTARPSDQAQAVTQPQTQAPTQTTQAAPDTQAKADTQSTPDTIKAPPAQDVSVVLSLDDSAANSQTKDAASAQNSAPHNGALCKIRNVATKFIGTPYRWGGTTPAAFDCSGFTRYVYSSLGVKIPRTAREQYKAGKPVPVKNLRTGDLVFFDMAKGYVSHVGLYLGNGIFIHASNPRTGVKYSNLFDRSYSRCFVGARRYQFA